MESNLPQIKVIVVGDSGVGKSSILFRFVNDEFNEFSEATLGAAFVSKVHTYGQDKFIRFQIWDTAGQEKYKSIAPIYYRGTSLLS
jgi:small GTP-binding protein